MDFDRKAEIMGIDYKILRETTELSVEEFARELDVSPELVRDWETGAAVPDAMKQKKLFALVKKIAERGQ